MEYKKIVVASIIAAGLILPSLSQAEGVKHTPIKSKSTRIQNTKVAGQKIKINKITPRAATALQKTQNQRNNLKFKALKHIENQPGKASSTLGVPRVISIPGQGIRRGSASGRAKNVPGAYINTSPSAGSIGKAEAALSTGDRHRFSRGHKQSVGTSAARRTRNPSGRSTPSGYAPETHDSNGVPSYTLSNGAQTPRTSPDGRIGKANSDGSVSYPDGTTVSVGSNGGTVISRHGIVTNSSVNGHSTYTLSNGVKVLRTSPNGQRGKIGDDGVVTYSDGTTISAGSSGGAVVSRSGIHFTTNSDGESTYTLQNGEQVPRSGSDGRMGTIDSNGHITYSDGTTVYVSDKGDTVVSRAGEIISIITGKGVKEHREGNRDGAIPVPHLDLTGSSDSDDDDDSSDSSSSKDSDSSGSSSSGNDDSSDDNSDSKDDDSDSDEDSSEDTSSESDEGTTEEEEGEPEGEEDESTGADDRGTSERGTARKMLDDAIANRQSDDGCSKQPESLVNPMGQGSGCTSGEKPSGPKKERSDREAVVLGDERSGGDSTNPLDLVSQPIGEGTSGEGSATMGTPIDIFERVGNPGDF